MCCRDYIIYYAVAVMRLCFAIPLAQEQGTEGIGLTREWGWRGVVGWLRALCFTIPSGQDKASVERVRGGADWSCYSVSSGGGDRGESVETALLHYPIC